MNKTTYENNILTLWGDDRRVLGEWERRRNGPSSADAKEVWDWWKALGRRLGIDFQAPGLLLYPFNRYTWKLVKLPARCTRTPEEALRAQGDANLLTTLTTTEGESK